MYSEWSEFGGGNALGSLLPNANLTSRTRDFLKMNNIGRLTQLKDHWKQMAGKSSHPQISNVINQVSSALDAYVNNQSPEAKSKIVDLLNRIDKARQSNNVNDLGVGNVQMSERNNNPKANWQVRRGQRAVGESWSMNLDED